MPFKQAELKPVISSAEQADRVLFLHAAVGISRGSELAKSGVVVLSGLTHVGVAMRQMLERARFKLAPPADVAASPPRDISAHLKSADIVRIRQQVAAARCRHRVAGRSAGDARRDALDAAIARVGFPLVMKIQSRDIPHKSEVGGVRVNIATKGEAFAAYQALLDNARRHRPEAAIQGVLVGPMAEKGVEIIVGTLLDATFGPMVMVGLGGITTELFSDVIYRPAPVSAAEATAMLAELKAAPLLSGFRGAAKADIPALAQLISQISVLAAQCRATDCRDRAQSGAGASGGHGVTIVDALVVRKPA